MSVSPADLVLSPRPLEAAPLTDMPRWWMQNDPIATAVMNALSLTFPEGERFFIQSVKRFSEGLPERLKEDVRAFTLQEGAHTREHVNFNAAVSRSGYDVAGVDALVQARLEIARTRPPLLQLAATVALEHFTASFAHLVLSDPSLFSDTPAELTRLWQWHSIEEIEHKGVAYDVFMHAAGHLSPWRRWMIRRWAMVLATLLFTSAIRHAALMLLKQDGITGLGARIALAGWLWRKPGLYRRITREYLAFYKPNFHPWQVDDRGLIAGAAQSLGLGQTAA